MTDTEGTIEFLYAYTPELYEALDKARDLDLPIDFIKTCGCVWRKVSYNPSGYRDMHNYPWFRLIPCEGCSESKSVMNEGVRGHRWLPSPPDDLHAVRVPKSHPLAKYEGNRVEYILWKPNAAQYAQVEGETVTWHSQPVPREVYMRKDYRLTFDHATRYPSRDAADEAFLRVLTWRDYARVIAIPT